MVNSRQRIKWSASAFLMVGVLLGLIYCAAIRNRLIPVPPHSISPTTAFTQLWQGNLRFVNSARTLSTDTSHDAEYRHQLSQGQHPIAAVLCCSDSRVCPEFIFDQPMGSIFEIRNAGNVVDDDVLASFEYSVEHLHVPLLLVLGHKGCGAIHAICEAGDRPLHHHLIELQKHMGEIRPAIIAARGHLDSHAIDQLAKENAQHQAQHVLRDSAFLQAAADRHEVELLYGIYDLDTGLVEFFEMRPSRE
jgi:carbonic anhydrase